MRTWLSACFFTGTTKASHVEKAEVKQFMAGAVSKEAERMMPGARWNQMEWMWAVRNLVAALAATVLASILSEVQAFRDASLGASGLSAAEAVRFLGYGTALGLIWVSAWRVAAQIPESGPLLSLLHHALPPFATLVALPGAYRLLLFPLHPFLSNGVGTVFSWIFVLPFVTTAVWFGLVLYTNADALVLLAAAAARRLSSAVEGAAPACRACGATTSADAKFCSKCGSSMGPAAVRDGQGADLIAK